MKKKKIDFKRDLPKKIGERFFPKVITSELVIIKCHLLIEYSLDYFINTVTNNRYESENYDFTFSQKSKIAILLGLDEHDPGKEIRFFIEKLNTLRNQIAHNIEFDYKLLDTICDKANYYTESKYGTLDHFYQLILRGKASWMAGRISLIAENLFIEFKLTDTLEK